MTSQPPSPVTPSSRADTVTVQELLLKLTQNRLHLPEFQRGLRWRDDDKIRLLDSVLRGIPIGTLLLSDPFVDPPMTTLLGEFVLDGQQRIQTLRAMVAPVAVGERALHLDTASRTFRFARVETLESDSTLVPVALLGDRDALLDALIAASVPRATLATALDVSQRMREYRVPIYSLHNASESMARMVFDRVNASGRRLRQSEVFNALHARSGSDPVKNTLQVVHDLESLGFGSLAEDEVTKTLAVLLGHDPSRDVRSLSLPDPASTMERTEKALRRAILFLRDDADVPHRAVLPYFMPLLVLARFLDLHPEPSSRSRILLRRWVWRGAATGAHQGARAPLREVLSAVNGDEDATVQALLASVPRDPERFAFSALRPVRRRHAADRVAFCALATRRPVDLRDGAPLDIAALASAWRVSSTVAPEEGGGVWAAALLHPKLRRAEIVRRLLGAPEAHRLTHVVSIEARDALALGDIAQFLTLRGADIDQRVRRFLVARAEWSASDHPSLAPLAESA